MTLLRVAGATALLLLTACSSPGSPTEDEQAAAVSDLMAAMTLTDADGPSVVTSKDLRYLVGGGVAGATTDEAVQSAIEALEAQGWTVDAEQDVPGGRQVLADTEELSSYVAVYEEVAGRPPAGGGVWVQIGVAVPDERLAWTSEGSSRS